ncbi:plasmid recombination protein, partial [Pseudoruminococcus massiliensis]
WYRLTIVCLYSWVYFGFFEDIFYSSFFCLLFYHTCPLFYYISKNMSAESENGQLARQILDEYYRGFQERNPNLKVFSAHLHMDEATPHLHIDFVPFTIRSKRCLDTRVRLK